MKKDDMLEITIDCGLGLQIDLDGLHAGDGLEGLFHARLAVLAHHSFNFKRHNKDSFPVFLHSISKRAVCQSLAFSAAPRYYSSQKEAERWM